MLHLFHIEFQFPFQLIRFVTFVSPKSCSDLCYSVVVSIEGTFYSHKLQISMYHNINKKYDLCELLQVQNNYLGNFCQNSIRV